MEEVENKYLIIIMNQFEGIQFDELVIFFRLLLVAFYLFRLLLTIDYIVIQQKYISKIRHVLMEQMFSHFYILSINIFPVLMVPLPSLDLSSQLPPLHGDQR